MGKRSRKREAPAGRDVRPQRVVAPAPKRTPPPPRRDDAVRAANWTRGYGERPKPPWGDVPVSEIAILAGGIALLVGFVQGSGGRTTVLVGMVVSVLGVLELTLREHLSGFRSHTVFLAFAPVIAVLAVLALGLGLTGIVTLAIAVPLFAALFFGLRAAFGRARERRVLGT